MDCLSRSTQFGENRYLDTRGTITEPLPFTQVVLEGLASGGGLFVPCEIPHFSLDEVLALAEMPYAKRAAFVYRAFNIDLPDVVIDEVMGASYADNFDTEEICPLHPLDEKTHVLELWHGPTSAFKDMALQCLPHVFSKSAQALREQGKLHTDFMILVATSGDTGKAALAGFQGVEGVRIGVLFPDGGVSDIQRKQMVTQGGDNVYVWAVRGNFDDCQTGVKFAFDDPVFADHLAKNYDIALSSANSINWGRLMPQIVYYLSAYATLVSRGGVAAGDPIDICVPTGNFGNILAAWYAKQMGAPIERLICASNVNRVLTDFIETGTYDISDRPFILTPAPSMDILVSSNMERQLFELCGRSASLVKSWMEDLKTQRKFVVDDKTRESLQSNYVAASVNNEECLATIREVLSTYGYLVDSHTAIACKAGFDNRGTNPLVIVSTAHWAKFGPSVYRAVHHLAYEEELPAEAAALSGCELNNLVAQETGQSFIPRNLADLDNLPVRFTEVIDGDASTIERAVETFIRQTS